MSILATVILLATDGSEDSEVAARTAVELSRRVDSELHLVYVAPEHPYRHAYHDFHNREEVERFRREDRRVLDEHADIVREAGGTVAGTHLRVGQAAKEIVELAEELGAGLVVVGGRGHSRIRSALMGSVSDSIVTHAHCSVLIVRTYGEEEVRGYLPGKILVAFDGSKSSSEAAREARKISQATDSELHLVYAMQEERYRPHLGPEMWEGWEEGFERAKRQANSWLEGEAKRMRGEEMKSVEAHVVLGRPDAGIVWLAQELDTGLLVVGSRGHGGIRRALIGSVSNSVIRHAHCPVLVVRAGDAMSSRKEMST